MKTATIRIKGVSPYSQSRYYNINKLDREIPKSYEERTWMHRCHYDDQGRVFIPPMAFKNCLSEIAKFLSVQVPGKGKATFTKHFEAGVMVAAPMVLEPEVTIETIKGEWLFVPSDGIRGSGKRVEKCFPIIHNWGGTVEVIVVDDIITPEVFTAHLEKAGAFIGLGRFRPRQNGYYGRFVVDSIKWD